VWCAGRAPKVSTQQCLLPCTPPSCRRCVPGTPAHPGTRVQASCRTEYQSGLISLDNACDEANTGYEGPRRASSRWQQTTRYARMRFKVAPHQQPCVSNFLRQLLREGDAKQCHVGMSTACSPTNALHTPHQLQEG